MGGMLCGVSEGTSKGERKREPGTRGQTSCQCPLACVKIKVNWEFLSDVIFWL